MTSKVLYMPSPKISEFSLFRCWVIPYNTIPRCCNVSANKYITVNSRYYDMNGKQREYRYNQYIEISVDTSIQIPPGSSWSISDNRRTMQFHLVSCINTFENSINYIHSTKILKCYWTMDVTNYCKHLFCVLIDTYSPRNVAFWSEKQISLRIISHQTCMSTLCFSERLVHRYVSIVLVAYKNRRLLYNYILCARLKLDSEFTLHACIKLI